MKKNETIIMGNIHSDKDVIMCMLILGLCKLLSDTEPKIEYHTQYTSVIAGEHDDGDVKSYTITVAIKDTYKKPYRHQHLLVSDFMYEPGLRGLVPYYCKLVKLPKSQVNEVNSFICSLLKNTSYLIMGDGTNLIPANDNIVKNLTKHYSISTGSNIISAILPHLRFKSSNKTMLLLNKLLHIEDMKTYNVSTWNGIERLASFKDGDVDIVEGTVYPIKVQTDLSDVIEAPIESFKVTG